MVNQKHSEFRLSILVGQGRPNELSMGRRVGVGDYLLCCSETSEISLTLNSYVKQASATSKRDITNSLINRSLKYSHT